MNEDVLIKSIRSVHSKIIKLSAHVRNRVDLLNRSSDVMSANILWLKNRQQQVIHERAKKRIETEREIEIAKNASLKLNHAISKARSSRVDSHNAAKNTSTTKKNEVKNSVSLDPEKGDPAITTHNCTSDSEDITPISLPKLNKDLINLIKSHYELCCFEVQLVEQQLKALQNFIKCIQLKNDEDTYEAPDIVSKKEWEIKTIAVMKNQAKLVKCLKSHFSTNEEHAEDPISPGSLIDSDAHAIERIKMVFPNWFRMNLVRVDKFLTL
jgi:hypothetical protein